MALGKRWSLTFKSLNNVECNVYIYDEGWTGAVTALIGADEPFFYQEDDDESLLTVLRYRTGYLRVVENSYNALQDSQKANLAPVAKTPAEPKSRKEMRASNEYARAFCYAIRNGITALGLVVEDTASGARLRTKE